MADEAKITFELVDRSGPGSASANPQIPGAGQVPGASLASDFHQRVTSTGLPEPGTGSAAAPPAPEIPSPAVAPAQAAGPLAAPTPQPATAGPSVTRESDPLLEAVRQIVSADPRTTAEEIQKALGVEAKRAAALMSAAVPTPAPQPDAGDRISQPPSLSREQQLAESERRAPPVVQAPQPPESPEYYSKDTASAVSGIIGNITQTAASLGGPLGRAAGGVLASAGPQLAAAAGAAPSLAGIATIAGPLAAIPAGILAGVGVAVGIERALINEGERARSLIGGLSPEVARAEAEADVRQVMANLRTSRRLGDEVAEIVEGRSRLSASLQGLRDVASEGVLRDFGNVVGALAGAAEALNRFVESSPGVQKSIQDSISDSIISAFLPLGGTLFTEQIKEFFEQANKLLKKREGLNNPFQWFGSMDHVAPADWVSGDTIKPSATEFDEIPGLSSSGF